MGLPIVRAVDVGYGYTKYVADPTCQPSRCAQFPSVVPRAAKSALSSSVGSKRNTVTVQIGDDEFEVGPDAELAQGALSFDRVMTTDFSTSKSYLALISGALFYMGQPRIDLLILGLPVNTWEHHKDALQDNFGNTLINIGGTEITLDKVKVVPQPYGGYAFLAKSGIDTQGIENVMVIDPGFGTLDWIVVNNGKINDARCGKTALRSHAKKLLFLIVSKHLAANTPFRQKSAYQANAQGQAESAVHTLVKEKSVLTEIGAGLKMKQITPLKMGWFSRKSLYPERAFLVIHQTKKRRPPNVGSGPEFRRRNPKPQAGLGFAGLAER